MSRSAIARFFTVALPLLLVAVVMTLGALSVVRQVESFQPLGVSVAAQGGGWRVTAVSDSSTGLAAGDLLLLINGETAAGPDALRQRLTARSESSLTVQRGSELATVAYQRPPLDFDVSYLILALIGALYLAVGFYTLIKDRRQQGLVFFCWTLASAALYLYKTAPAYPFLDPPRFDTFAKLISTLDGLALLLVAPLTLHLLLVFPRRLRALGRVVPFFYLPAAVLAAAQLDYALFNGRLVMGPPSGAVLRALDRFELYHLVLFVAVALLVLAHRLQRSVEEDERRQLRWIALGVGGGYLPFFLLHVVPLSLFGGTTELLSAASVLPLVLVPLAFAYVLLRYQLRDLDVLLRNTTAYTFTAFLAVLGFSLIKLVLDSGVLAEMAAARTVVSFGAGLTLAGMLAPTRRAIGSSLDRLHYGGAFGKRRLLARLGRELLQERDLDRLCAALLDRLAEGLELSAANIYLVQREHLVAVRPHPGLPAQLPVELLTSEEWEGEVTAISGLTVPAAAPAPSRRLFFAGYRYAFPLVVHEGRVGVMLTGYKEDQIPLNSEDVELIRQVLNQAALALENAQLLDRLHHQLEEVLRLQRYSEGIIESSPAGIAVLDTAGRVASANLTFAALVGRERRELAGCELEGLLPVALPEPSDGVVEASLRGDGDGERYLQLSVARLALDADHQRILMIQDVTERVQMEHELKEKDRLASLGMLAAGVAHEVNTPITGISSYAQMLLQETDESDPRYALLEKMERQTFRAARIVASLLDFARRRSGEERPVALAVCLEEAIDQVRERCDEQGVELRFRPPAEPVSVLGGDTDLQQVFVNLLTNALDAMPGGGRLAVTLGVDARRARVEVEDTGDGIPQENIDKIFQPFFSTKLTAGGTGLGLSISYEIVRRHGGEMRVVSRPGEGSRFLVELPLLHEEAGVEEMAW